MGIAVYNSRGTAARFFREARARMHGQTGAEEIFDDEDRLAVCTGGCVYLGLANFAGGFGCMVASGSPFPVGLLGRHTGGRGQSR